MNAAVMDSLLEKARQNPLPAQHTSSYWQDYGQRVTVDRHADVLRLESSAFETVHPLGLPGRVLHWLERASYAPVTGSLKNYPRVWKNAYRLARDLGGDPNFNVFKASAIVSLLADHWETQRLKPKTFAIIGDGFGFLGALIRRTVVQDIHLYCVDLPKSLVFQAQTHLTADPQTRLAALSDRRVGDDAPHITFVAAPDVEQVPETIDCAINISSMQEMNPFSIRTYFTFLRKRSTSQSHFYCLNRLRKELPGGEVASFMDYPWHSQDRIFVDGVCPFYTHYMASTKALQGLRLLGIRVPFVNYFDGEHVHRLVHLKSTP